MNKKHLIIGVTAAAVVVLLVVVVNLGLNLAQTVPVLYTAKYQEAGVPFSNPGCGGTTGGAYVCEIPSGNYLTKSDDSFQTSSKLLNVPLSNIKFVTHPDAIANFIIAGGAGSVAVSFDNGATWTQHGEQNSTCYDTAAGGSAQLVACRDAGTGGGAIFASHDGGQTFDVDLTAPAPLTVIKSGSSNFTTAFVAGENGYYAYTSDPLSPTPTWTVGPSLGAVDAVVGACNKTAAFTNDCYLVVRDRATNVYQLLKSLDQGVSWVTVGVTPVTTVTDISAVDGRLWIVGGDNGNAFISDSQGQTWDSIPFAEPLTGVEALSLNFAIVTTVGQILEVLVNLPPPGCQSNADCGAGSVCQAGQCVPAGCQSDADCGYNATGDICDVGSCRPGCRVDSDCPSGNLCNQSTYLCEAIPETPPCNSGNPSCTAVIPLSAEVPECPPDPSGTCNDIFGFTGSFGTCAASSSTLTLLCSNSAMTSGMCTPSAIPAPTESVTYSSSTQCPGAPGVYRASQNDEPEDCADTIDNDLDGYTDSEDPDCPPSGTGFVACMAGGSTVDDSSLGACNFKLTEQCCMSPSPTNSCSQVSPGNYRGTCEPLTIIIDNPVTGGDRVSDCGAWNQDTQTYTLDRRCDNRIIQVEIPNVTVQCSALDSSCGIAHSQDRSGSGYPCISFKSNAHNGRVANFTCIQAAFGVLIHAHGVDVTNSQFINVRDGVTVGLASGDPGPSVAAGGFDFDVSCLGTKESCVNVGVGSPFTGSYAPSTIQVNDVVDAGIRPTGSKIAVRIRNLPRVTVQNSNCEKSGLCVDIDNNEVRQNGIPQEVRITNLTANGNAAVRLLGTDGAEVNNVVGTYSSAYSSLGKNICVEERTTSGTLMTNLSCAGYGTGVWFTDSRGPRITNCAITDTESAIVALANREFDIKTGAFITTTVPTNVVVTGCSFAKPDLSGINGQCLLTGTCQFGIGGDIVGADFDTSNPPHRGEACNSFQLGINDYGRSASEPFSFCYTTDGCTPPPDTNCRDTDRDLITDDLDNCPTVPNTDQADADGDGQGDACQDTDSDTIFDSQDNCLNVPNTDQADFDEDCPAQPYAADPLCGDACDPDIDNDTYLNAVDACPKSPLGSSVNAVGCPLAACLPFTIAAGGIHIPTSTSSWFPGDYNALDYFERNPAAFKPNPPTNSARANAVGLVFKSFIFDGVDDKIELPAQPVTNIFPPVAPGTVTSTFTIDFWAKASPGASLGNDRPTFGFSGSSEFYQYPIECSSNQCHVSNGRCVNCVVTWAPIPSASTAAWKHYAIVSDGAHYRMFVDGLELDLNGGLAGLGMPNGGIFPASPTNRSFVIGQTGGFAPFHEPFKGQIDEFDIVSRALTPLEVKAIHLAGPYGKCKTDEDVVAVTPVPDGCPTHIEDKNKNDIFEPNGPDGNPLTLGDNETDWLDPDTDNDGRYDCAAPGSEDQNNNGIFEPAGFDEDLCTDDDETNPLIADTDGDGLTDGYELGMTAPENPLFSAENFVPDDDPSTTSCPNKADTDDDGVGDATDLCPTTSGLTLTGCPFADKQTVDLHIIDQAKRGDCNGAGSCKKRIAGSEVRIFDRNKLNGFSITLLSGGSATLTKNPSGDLYDDIFESANAQTTARVGKCTTDFFGTCTAGEETKGDFLVIVKSKDTETNTLVYTGLPKGLSDFVDTNGDGDGDLATKEFQVIKVIRKDGGIEFKGGVKRVVAGSILEIVYPESTVWEGVKQVYPFIFTSDSSWTVDVCLEIPTGYSIVGIYDENGNLLSTTQCQQTFVTGQTKIVAFEVNELSSPPPHMKAKLKLKGPKGNVQTFDLDIPGKRVEKAVAPKEGGFIRFLKNLLQGLGF